MASIYTTKFIDGLSTNVKHICLTHEDDYTNSDFEYQEPLYVFKLKEGKGRNKLWTCDILSYSNWGLIPMSNAQVAQTIREFLKEHPDGDVMFGDDTSINMDWSEARLAGRRTSAPKKKQPCVKINFNNMI